MMMDVLYCYPDGTQELKREERPDLPEPAPALSVWDELDAAYQEGVDSI